MMLTMLGAIVKVSSTGDRATGICATLNLIMQEHNFPPTAQPFAGNNET
jgi:hypothetical protein